MSSPLYVLILFATFGMHGASVTTADFYSKEACETAGKAAEETATGLRAMRYKCVHK